MVEPMQHQTDRKAKGKAKGGRTTPERFTYRVENTAGELLGTVRATDEGEAYREACHRFAGMGINVRLR